MEDAYNKLADAIRHQADKILVAGEAIEKDRLERVADLEEKQSVQRQVEHNL